MYKCEYICGMGQFEFEVKDLVIFWCRVLMI